MRRLIRFSVEHPWVIITSVLISVVLSVFQYTRIKVDTDPENMLSKNEFVRIFHNRTKKEFSLYDFIVLGIVNDKHPQGVFNVDTLTKIYHISRKIEKIDGVISYELISPATKDDIEQAGLGAVRFKWLMPKPPTTEKEALHIRSRIMDNPVFYGTVVSEDGKALCLYVPIERKDMSWRVSKEIKKIVSEYRGNEKYYMTGLPIAEDTFGHEMFVQMAISAPLAGLVIFLLMWMFFKKINLIVAPMLLSIITVIITMGLLIGFGFPVHIMSSMIPIFIIPIAVLDSVHILSEFFDRYRKIGDRKKTIIDVIDTLFVPMLYTSLTTWAGFLSLAFSPIPPVQVFGFFVSVGVAIAWVLTMLFIPAYVALIKPESLKNFGAAKEKGTFMDKVLFSLGKFATGRWRLVLSITLIITGVSLWGITRIQVNDNPVKWFTKKHPIRIADKVLNTHFGGTYMAYLVMEAEDKDAEIFKRPQMLKFVAQLQRYLKEKGKVGKSTSLSDVVKKVYYELLGANREYYKIPPTKQAVAQCLISFQNSHKPDDLWHFVTPDYSKLNLWIQLKSGDNKDMEEVIKQVDEFMKTNPPPYKVKYNWAGLTYVNVAWQNKMVVGMLRNFLGSFIIVYFMMAFLFGSPITALISMIPLTVTIVFIYGFLGITGRDYDMPVAVLSALTLGLSIDFAIHFIQRSRASYDKTGNWLDTSTYMFGEPGRAILRNAVVVAVGFLPLLVAPLVPYQTVGFFMAAIMFASSLATIFILPAIISWKPAIVYIKREKHFLCYPGDCIFLGAVIALSVLYVILGYTRLGVRAVVFITVVVFLVCACLCRCVLKNEKVCSILGLEKK